MSRNQRISILIAVALMITLLAILASCVPGDIIAGEGIEGGIARNIDEEAGVVCYIYTAHGTISCVPLDQTCLDQGKGD